MSMVPTEIENLRGEQWAENLKSTLRHGKELSNLQQRIEALETERDCYQKALSAYAERMNWSAVPDDEHRDPYDGEEWWIGEYGTGPNLARAALEQGVKIREGK